MAVPSALLVVVLGILPLRAALDELRGLGPTIGFLAAVLLLAELCDRESLFETVGQRMAGVAVADRSPCSDAGLGGLVERLVPVGGSLWSLLAVAAFAALLANLVNNLPALLLLSAAAAAGPGTVMAALIGVNIGPNLTDVGSLATLPWRRVLRERDAEPSVGELLPAVELDQLWRAAR